MPGTLKSQAFDHELNVALDLAREAGAAILEFYEGPLQIEQKTGFDDREPVTQADRVANELIVNALRKEFPNDGILAEESVDTAHRLDKPRVWMIDPLDGTNGFIDGNGDFAVQIGLTQDGQCVLGVVHQPLTGVLYHAVRGQGTWIIRPDLKPERAAVSDQNRAFTHAAGREPVAPQPADGQGGQSSQGPGGDSAWLGRDQGRSHSRTTVRPLRPSLAAHEAMGYVCPGNYPDRGRWAAYGSLWPAAPIQHTRSAKPQRDHCQQRRSPRTSCRHARAAASGFWPATDLGQVSGAGCQVPVRVLLNHPTPDTWHPAPDQTFCLKRKLATELISSFSTSRWERLLAHSP